MEPPFSITNSMITAVADISQQVGKLQIQVESNLHLRKENRIRSIHSSLAIENNSLTLEQVTAIINGQPVLGDPKEIREVTNAYATYAEILTFDPYNVADFLKAHALMAEGLVAQAGAFRQKDVGIYDAHGNLVHMGARPSYISKLIKELFSWSEEDDTPDLIKSCVMHYEIELIHPFEDANGRMGRLWQSVLLSHWNEIFAWLPVETMVYAHQEEYYSVLALADKNNDSTCFIEFMLKIIKETLDTYAVEKMSDKLTPQEQAAFQNIFPYLQTHRTISNKQAVALTGKSEATVRRYFRRFVEVGLLEAVGENKNRRYCLNEAGFKGIL